MKFSIIVPIYNVEEYLDRCLKSIVLQCYTNYEVIMVCDKSDDKSNKITKEYEKKYYKFKRIYYEKTGLAKAKNIGVKHAIGDYILFLDGDDYYESDLLSTLKKEIEDNTEIIRFQIRDIKNNDSINYNEKAFKSMSGNKAFDIIKTFHYVEPSWAYCYKKEFWDKNNFAFMENCIAEDFGLTPLVISKAKCVKSINYIGYNYVMRSNSLMNNDDYMSKLKKTDDIIKQSEFLFQNINKEKNISFYEFISSTLITQVASLKYRDYRKYMKKIKKYNVFKFWPQDSFKRKIKKAILMINPYIYKNYIERFI